MKGLILLLICNGEYNPRAYYAWIYGEIKILLQIININYHISRPIRRTFPPKNVTYIRPASYVPRVSIVSKLINTHTSIIQHIYREIVKTTMKMILVAVMMIFGVSMMNKLYYGC